MLILIDASFVSKSAVLDQSAVEGAAAVPSWAMVEVQIHFGQICRVITCPDTIL